jgi:hypothetical protein
MCRPLGTRVIALILPGTAVPGAPLSGIDLHFVRRLRWGGFPSIENALSLHEIVDLTAVAPAEILATE